MPRVDRNALIEGSNVLGKGTFGEVFLLFRGEDRTARALKLVTNQSVAARQLVNEARIHSELRHNNIVALEGVSSDTDPKSYFLILEYLGGGTLRNLLNQWRNEYRQKIRRHLKKWACPNTLTKEESEMYNRIEQAGAIGIAKGLAHLHSKEIVYYDLKPGNICYMV